MWKIRKKCFAGIVAMILIICMMPITNVQAKEPTKESNELSKVQVVDLIADEDQKVGTVTIERNGDRYLKATYELDEAATKEGWRIYEINLAVGDKLSDISKARGNHGWNHGLGRFPYSRSFRNGVQKYVLDQISISSYRYSKDLYISANAVVKMTNNNVVKAPYGGTKVYDYNQGLDYNGDKVITERSNPENGLYYETSMNQKNFYSLGFGNIDMKTGWIIIEFGNPIINGCGDDIEVIEDTWLQPYNIEQAVVSVSNDKRHWIKLGVAGNGNPISQYHSSTKFDLSDICMWSAKYVMLQDISDYSPSDLGYPTDGFDLNAVLALHDYNNRSSVEETAWAEGKKINQKNDAMYFTYQINNQQFGCKCFYYYFYWFFMGSKPKGKC